MMKFVCWHLQSHSKAVYITEQSFTRQKVNFVEKASTKSMLFWHTRRDSFASAVGRERFGSIQLESATLVRVAFDCPNP